GEEHQKPLITYIIVGKRSVFSIICLHTQNGGDRSGNCPAGFVADKGINSPITADFFLLSHDGLLGNARPSHYTLLRDNIYGNNLDVLQNLSFTLCHCYAKATRSVSIPAPMYCE
ncbi:stem cell self-renewal protein Piwi, partial [Athelia psychrophila]